MQESMQAYVLEGAVDNVVGRLGDLPTAELPDGEVTIRVSHSTINYKDAMIAAGVGKMVRTFPHVPGVDLSGRVEADRSGRFRPGDRVLVTGYDLGVSWYGGYAQYARVPAEWVVPLPDGLDEWEAMALGTAGFTAMLSVMAMERNGLAPGQGPVLVTGATGGVGSVAIDVLARLGYEVAASSGKADMHDYLARLGAGRVLSRADAADASPKVMLRETWAGAVDAVGGDTTAYLVRSAKRGGSVALCGLVGSHEVKATVYPFILRGVNLLGIDSVYCPREEREEAWRRLAGPAKPAHLSDIGHTIPLAELPDKLKEILGGGARGRYVVQMPA